MKRLHLHLSVDDLAAAVRFYGVLFAAEPTLVKPDYAKWMLDDPRVNFAISARGAATGLDHLGIQVETARELQEVYGRLQQAGRPVLEEGATTCCYARSEKSWIADPQGLPWETFLTSGDSAVYGHDTGLGAIREASGACCAPRPEGAVDVVIYHNPDCGTSRNTLAMIRNAGIEPHVVEYLKTPPSRALLAQLIRRAGLTPRAILREKGTPYAELGLDDPSLDDEQLLDAMGRHPILMNRPIVVTPLGVRLCRPSEQVLDILPHPQQGAFAKEDGEPVIDERGHRPA